MNSPVFFVAVLLDPLNHIPGVISDEADSGLIDAYRHGEDLFNERESRFKLTGVHQKASMENSFLVGNTGGSYIRRLQERIQNFERVRVVYLWGGFNCSMTLHLDLIPERWIP